MQKILVLVCIILMHLGARVYAGWAEQTLKDLTLQEKIGQLFVIPASPSYEMGALLEVLKNYHVGAILIKQAHPLQQISFLNQLQSHAILPLLCAGDAEWGLGMRMEDTLSFPKNLTLGAIQDDTLIYELGKTIGKQCKLVGIHLNFAPVVDVNINPNNPIIGMRSFGDNPANVGNRGALMVQGMQDAGILACAKHFPGHGDVHIDSHRALPIIYHSLKHLERVELMPFFTAIAVGVNAIMSAHILFPNLDPIYPASLSHKIMTTILKKRLKFTGLLISDALNMQALSNKYSIEEIVTQAFIAGHDLLTFGAHRYDDLENILQKTLPIAFSAIERGVITGYLSEKELDAHVLKVLSAKEKLGLHKNRFLPLPHNLMEQLHSIEGIELQRILYRKAITVVHPMLIPTPSPGYMRLWENQPLPKAETIVVAINHANQIPRLQNICANHPKVIVALFASPYLLKDIPNVTTVIGYELCEASEQAVWDVITGKEKGGGKLPITPPK